MNTKLTPPLAAVVQPRLVRGCRVTKTDGSYYDGSYRSWQEPAVFHGWTKHSRCAIGDGSMIEWVTLAIIEWPDGSVDMCEPCAIQFQPAEHDAVEALRKMLRYDGGTGSECYDAQELRFARESAMQILSANDPAMARRAGSPNQTGG